MGLPVLLMSFKVVDKTIYVLFDSKITFSFISYRNNFSTYVENSSNKKMMPISPASIDGITVCALINF